MNRSQGRSIRSASSGRLADWSTVMMRPVLREDPAAARAIADPAEHRIADEAELSLPASEAIRGARERARVATELRQAEKAGS
jgi:hypothetical protein